MRHYDVMLAYLQLSTNDSHLILTARGVRLNVTVAQTHATQKQNIVWLILAF
jgi:hypothetical protein